MPFAFIFHCFFSVTAYFCFLYLLRKGSLYRYAFIAIVKAPVSAIIISIVVIAVMMVVRSLILYILPH